jgi:hypothetical protein
MWKSLRLIEGSRRWFALFLLLVITFCAGIMHRLGPDYAYESMSASSSTRLVPDSPAIDQLLARNDLIAGQDWPGHTYEERVRGYEDQMRHRDEFKAEHQPLFDAMAIGSGVTVEGRQYFRLLRQSTTSCEPSGSVSSSIYILVRTSTGPSKGKEGWVCTKDVGPSGDLVF